MDESERKAAGLLLWGLMGTAEEDLAKFRRQRIGRSSSLDLHHLRRLQSIMAALGEAIRADDDDRWKLVNEAWSALHDPSPKSEPQPSPASTADPDPEPEAPVPEPPLPPRGSAGAGRLESPWVQKPPTASWSRPGPGARTQTPGVPQPHRTEDDTSVLPDVESRARAAADWDEHTKTEVASVASGQREPSTVLPFVDADPEKKPPGAPVIDLPDPEDPESETIRLRAHVLPFKKKRAQDPAASAPPKPHPRRPPPPKHRVTFQRPAPPPPSEPTRVPVPSAPAAKGDEQLVDEPTNVSSMAKTRERTARMERGPHGLPVLHDDEDADEHRLTKVRAVPVTLRVDRYALFCAQCVVFPDRLAETRAQHGIVDENEHQRLDQGWMARFAANPVLQQKWRVLFDVHRAKLARR